MRDRLSTTEYSILPGLVDVHVHLREPGFLYKETIATGTLAAAAGGFTSICSMPNLKPCPDCVEGLQVQLDAIDRDALVNVYPYGAITGAQKGERLASMKDIADNVIAFTDDGVGVMSDELMEQAMINARDLGKIIVAHCEDTRYPKASSEAEWKQLQRDLDLVRKTGCKYHACHISTKESVELIRNAKAEGLDVTCETAPHYLLLTRDDVQRAIDGYESRQGSGADNGQTNGTPLPGWFKMNPPIKGQEDRKALIEAVKDGTIDMIATDHAPHGADEKSKSFNECAFGIVGLETAFPLMYTYLVLEGIITLDKLVELMSTAPAKRFGIGEDKSQSYSEWDLDTEYTIDSSNFLSKGKAMPFEGWKVKGRCMKTVVKGKEVYRYE